MSEHNIIELIMWAVGIIIAAGIAVEYRQAADQEEYRRAAGLPPKQSRDDDSHWPRLGL